MIRYKFAKYATPECWGNTLPHPNPMVVVGLSLERSLTDSISIKWAVPKLIHFTTFLIFYSGVILVELRCHNRVHQTLRHTYALADSAPMADSYTYSPLSQRSFRLLRFTSDTTSDEVECELAIFLLSETPKYNALSYCWGNTTRSRSILCNGRRMMITPILKEALNQLIILDRGGIKWIWIDQICIDQINFRERANQVNIMKDIYQKSEGTIIWLGPDIHGIESLRSLTEKILNLHNKDLNFDGSRKRRRYTIEEYRASNLPPAEDLSWKALVEVLSRPWFVRSWIIQEAALSKVSPRILCGPHELSWEKILPAAAWLTSMCYNLSPVNLGTTNTPALRSLKLLNELRNVGLPWDLTTLLNKAIRFKASEPRDRVYSLLGLAREAEDTSSLPIPLQANYDKPVRDVFRDATRYIIMSAMNLTVLTLIRYIPDWYKYPSWVVDFARDVQWERISYFTWSHHVRGWNSVRETPNDAAGGLPIDVRESPSNDILTLRGLRIDIISTTCEVMSKSALNSLRPQALFAWKEACQRLKTRYPTIVALAHAFMVTLTANWSLTERELVADQPVSHFWAYIWRVYRRLYEEAKSDEDRADIGKEYSSLVIMPNASGTGDADLYRLHLDAAHNRRIFFTKDKSYIGLGPSIMRENDTLCIVFGGATPMILRPEGDCYRFVGECYVYDLMNGEAITDWRSGNYTAQTFQLV